MASILPFIRKYINSKEKTIDKQIEELANGIGASSDGALIVQSLGSFVLTTSGETFTPPENGVYRIIVTGEGGTPVAQSANVNAAGAGTAIMICRLSTKDNLTVKTNAYVANSDYDHSNGIRVNINDDQLIFIPNVCHSGNTSNFYQKEYIDIGTNDKILSMATYSGLTNGSVGVYIPGLTANPYLGVPNIYKGNYSYNVYYPSGVGFAGHTGAVVSSSSGVSFGAQGYGAGGITNGTDHRDVSNRSVGGPAACIITLLKKE